MNDSNMIRINFSRFVQSFDDESDDDIKTVKEFLLGSSDEERQSTIHENPFIFEYLPKELQTKEIIDNEDILSSMELFEMIDMNLLDQDIYRKAVKINREVLFHVPVELQDHEMCLSAVDLGFADMDNIREDLYSVLLFKKLIENHPLKLDIVPERYHSPSIYKIAIEHGYEEYEKLREDMLTPLVVDLIIEKNPLNIRYIPVDKQTREIIEIVVTYICGIVQKLDTSCSPNSTKTLKKCLEIMNEEYLTYDLLMKCISSTPLMLNIIPPSKITEDMIKIYQDITYERKLTEKISDSFKSIPYYWMIPSLFAFMIMVIVTLASVIYSN
jgi:hypothetical protein